MQYEVRRWGAAELNRTVHVLQDLHVYSQWVNESMNVNEQCHEDFWTFWSILMPLQWVSPRKDINKQECMVCIIRIVFCFVWRHESCKRQLHSLVKFFGTAQKDSLPQKHFGAKHDGSGRQWKTRLDANFTPALLLCLRQMSWAIEILDDFDISGNWDFLQNSSAICAICHSSFLNQHFSYSYSMISWADAPRAPELSVCY